MNADPDNRKHRMDGVHAQSRIVLSELGFTSVWSFARASGVSHVSVSDLLYKPPEHRRQLMYKLSTVTKIFEALTFAYEQRQAKMDSKVRTVVRAWIKNWIASVMSRDVQTTNLVLRGTKDRRTIRQRENRLSKRRSQYSQIVETFK